MQNNQELNDTTMRYARTMSEAYSFERAFCTEGWQRRSLPFRFKPIGIALLVVYAILVVLFYK